MKDTLIVNLFGAPGAGKSTCAAYVFSQLKMRGIDAELVTEYAKDKVWEGNQKVFDNQIYILGKQSFRQSRLVGQVDVIITDSPLPLSIYYNKQEWLGENFNELCMSVFHQYKNISFYINRVKDYNPNGRFQTELQSDVIGKEMKQFLAHRGIPYIEVDGDLPGYNQLLEHIIVENSCKNLI